MTIPDYQSLMRPLLELLSDGSDWPLVELREALAEVVGVAGAEREHLLPSGKARIFDNRVAWAQTYLHKAGVIERPRRAVTRITERGRLVLSHNQGPIDNHVLDEFDEFRKFRTAKPEEGDLPPPRDSSPRTQRKSAEDSPAATPQEAIEGAFLQMNQSLASDLLDRLTACSPAFFEQVVVDVLLAMGYGGSQREAGERLGQSGDEGVDGVIREDVLGLDAIYVQAKCWAQHRTVGRPEIQGFVGALHGKRASKGVFLTTSTFTQEARQYVVGLTPRVVLIDGEHLAQLMIRHDVGVSTRQVFHLKRLDSDYFDEV